MNLILINYNKLINVLINEIERKTRLKLLQNSFQNEKTALI